MKNQRKESIFPDTANDYGNIPVANTPARRTLGNSISFAVDPKSLFRSNTNINAVNGRLGSSCSERVNANGAAKGVLLQNKPAAKISMQTIGQSDARGEMTIEGTT